jgi:CO/xanthine dehydrogenase Mo-binding subunit
LRGFGAPQTAWAYECHTDMIAEALGLDKLAFRRKNLLRDGRPQASGTIVRDAALDMVLDQLVDRMNWQLPFDIGTVDMGQGSDTVMAQIAAEVLNLDAENIRVIHPDTDVTPYDMGTLGSRSTFHMGTAVRLAAEDAQQKIEALAAELGLPQRSNIPLSELFRRKYGMQAGNIIGTGSFIPAYEKPDPMTGQSKNATPFWGVGASGAEVEIDIETGALTITKLVNIVDIGTAINPELARAQISGAAIMQLGFTTTEQMLFRDGQLTNNSLSEYKIPTLLEMPREFINEYVESRQASGPFGAKGAGESSTIALSPAIGNAVADAIGIHLTDLPLTPESIFRALQSADATLLGGG